MLKRNVGIVLMSVLVACGGGGGGSGAPPTQSPPTPPPALKALIEYSIPTANSMPSDIRLGSDGNLWFTEHGAAQIGRITSAGKINEYPIPSSARGITRGPDGALWFTTYLNQIGRITTAGVVTMYNLPAIPEPNPRCTGGIATGPDRALWFGAGMHIIGGIVREDTIVRITTDGKFTAYPLGSRGDSSVDAGTELVTGPDHALWFTTTQGIGRMTTAGTVTFYALPYAPVGIAVGPDHTLWSTGTGQIGRTTTAGQTTVYPTPTTNSRADLIAAGPDGNLWFGEDGKIGRISTTGSITEFPLASGASLLGMTAGPSGTMWFTEDGANKIGKFTP